MVITSEVLHGISRTLTQSALGILLTWTASTGPGLAQVDTVAADRPLSQRVLLMGTTSDYAPFEYRQGSEPGGSLVGFDIDIAEYIAEQLGFELQIRQYLFEAIFPALKAEELDFAIAAITPTGPRWQSFDFSRAYFETQHAILSRKNEQILTLSDLVGKRVAVQRGSLQEQALRLRIDREAVEMALLPFDRISDMVAAVQAAEIDAAIIEELVAVPILESRPDLVVNVLEEIPPTTMAIAFPRGSEYVEQFNQVLEEMEATGELERLAKRWFTDQP